MIKGERIDRDRKARKVREDVKDRTIDNMI